jgi:F0F1-type ATP synthase assembly protein I
VPGEQALPRGGGVAASILTALPVILAALAQNHRKPARRVHSPYLGGALIWGAVLLAIVIMIIIEDRRRPKP